MGSESQTPHSQLDDRVPTMAALREAAKQLEGMIFRTPVSAWVGAVLEHQLSPDTRVDCKLELFQFAGSFKARAALLKILALSEEERARGVVAVSAGNHAIAVSYAAQRLGVSAKVVMPKHVSKIRLDKCRMRAAEVVLTEDVTTAFHEADAIAQREGRVMIHPFEGYLTALGTATLGLEFLEQVPSLDAVIVSVGGGGLAAGVASAIAQCAPHCAVYGVEPEGAASISKSIEAGVPIRLDSVDTIATSLAAPLALPYSFGLCKKYLTEVVQVSDQAMCEAMTLLFYEMKLAVEPGCAAVAAALFGPLKQRLLGKHVGLILCGSSIDGESFSRLLARGEAYYQSIVTEITAG